MEKHLQPLAKRIRLNTEENCYSAVNLQCLYIKIKNYEDGLCTVIKDIVNYIELKKYKHIYINKLGSNWKMNSDKMCQLTREECDKIAFNPKITDPIEVPKHTAIDFDTKFEINGRLFASISGKKDSFMCIARKETTEGLMVGFSKKLTADTVIDSIKALTTSTNEDPTIQIGKTIVKFDKEKRTFSISGPDFMCNYIITSMIQTLASQ